MKAVGVFGVALATSALLGIVLLGTIARWLTLDENAAFVAVWGVVFSGSSIVSVIEQEASRQVTLSQARRQPVPGSVGQLAVLSVLGAAAALVILTFLPMGTRVFGGTLWLVALTFVSLTGFSVQFLVRGILLGRQRVGWYAFVIVAEASVRVVAIFILMLLGVEPSVTWAVAAVVIGSFGWVPVAKIAFTGVNWRHDREPWRVAGRRIGLLAVANGLLSLMITGYPTTVTAVIGSSQGLAIFFAIVTISRVPLTVLSPVQALVVPTTTKALYEGRGDQLLAMQGKILLGVLGFGVIAAAGGYLLGPWAVRLLFGPDYIATRQMVATLLGVTVVMGGALLQAAVFTSLERYSLTLVTWGTSAAATVAALAFTPGEAAVRGTAGFIAASAVGYLMSTILLRWALSRVGPGPVAVPADQPEQA